MRSRFARFARLRVPPVTLAVVAAPILVGAPMPGPAAQAWAAPEPSLIPTRWQLDITPGPLRVAEVLVSSQVAGPNGSVITVEEPRRFFYLTYTVTNATGQDLMFAPSFELATDAGELVKSGRGVPAEVTREVLNRLRNPFMQDQIGIIGNLGQGPENAKEGVVIWPADNLRVDEITIFASGFSGESERVRRPDTGEEVVLRKVLMLRHETPGTIARQGDDPLERVQQRWILR
ncbi:MAG: hypothetical protein ACF8QF_11565 [Phycisphaerales bacterium]